MHRLHRQWRANGLHCPTWTNDLTCTCLHSLVLGGVAIFMAPGSEYALLSVSKTVARLSLLFDFDPFAVVPNGGSFTTNSACK